MKKDIKQLTEKQKTQAVELLKQGVNRRDIAKQIHTRWGNLKAFFDEIQAPVKKQGVPLELYDKICELYKKGLSSREISELHFPQFSTNQIGYVCRKCNIVREPGCRSKLNHFYFSEIDCEAKAYWIGLLLADGCIQHDSKKNSWAISLSLKPEDKYLIDEFRKDIQTNLQVKSYVNNTGFASNGESSHIECRLKVHSKQMAKDLGKFGVIPQKSLLINSIPHMPDKFIRHFVRGFFDGNGSVTYGRKTPSSKKTPKILFYSTRKFCEELNSLFHEKLGCSLKKITTQKTANVSFLTYAKYDDVIALYNYMYHHSTVFLARKKDILTQYIAEYRDNPLK